MTLNSRQRDIFRSLLGSSLPHAASDVEAAAAALGAKAVLMSAGEPTPAADAVFATWSDELLARAAVHPDADKTLAALGEIAERLVDGEDYEVASAEADLAQRLDARDLWIACIDVLVALGRDAAAEAASAACGRVDTWLLADSSRDTLQSVAAFGAQRREDTRLGSRSIWHRVPQPLGDDSFPEEPLWKELNAALEAREFEVFMAIPQGGDGQRPPLPRRVGSEPPARRRVYPAGHAFAAGARPELESPAPAARLYVFEDGAEVFLETLDGPDEWVVTLAREQQTDDDEITGPPVRDHWDADGFLRALCGPGLAAVTHGGVSVTVRLEAGA